MPPRTKLNRSRVRFSTLQRELEELQLNDGVGNNTGPLNYAEKTVELEGNMFIQRKRKRSLQEDVDIGEVLSSREQISDDLKTLPEALQCLRRLKTFVVREGHTDVLDNIVQTENVLEEKWCEERLIGSASKTVKQTTLTDFFRKRQIVKMD